MFALMSLELKIPPPAVALLAGLLMRLASTLVAPFDAPFGARVAVAAALGVMAVGVALTAVLSFARAGTTLNPTRPDAVSSLVTGGVFRVTRNPMYLSLLIGLLGWAAYLGTWPALLLAWTFVLYINRFQIEPEERALSARFGPDYSAYKAKVRRWI